MIPQGAWRRMFNELRANKPIATLMRRIFEAKDQEQRITLVDELYAINQGQIQKLTGKSGITINLFLAAYDPFTNLAIVSLNETPAHGISRAFYPFRLGASIYWSAGCRKQHDSPQRPRSSGNRRLGQNPVCVLLLGAIQISLEGGAHNQATRQKRQRVCACDW